MSELRTRVVVAMVLATGAASAQSELPPVRGGQGWSVLSGQTVGAGENVLVGELGWPGLAGSWLHGFSDSVDLGARFAFNYSAEGVLTAVVPGLKLQGLARWAAVDTPTFNLGLAFKPGPFFYFQPLYTAAGLALPLELAAGIPVSSALMVSLGLDLPMYAVFGPAGGFVLPVLAGVGGEYFIDRRLAATARVRMGPTLFLATGGAAFTLELMLGVAYRL